MNPQIEIISDYRLSVPFREILELQRRLLGQLNFRLNFVRPGAFFDDMNHRFFSLAFLTLLFSFTVAPVSGAQPVPFRGSFSTTFQSVAVFPLVYVQVSGTGNATHLGRTVTTSSDQIVNVLTGEVTATYHLLGASGDTLILQINVQATPTPGGLLINGNWQVAGGLGRFANATGGGTLNGEAIFTGPDTGLDHFTLTGTISSLRQSK
jgi:hypothetical protein